MIQKGITMYCIKCGTPLNDGAQFCSSCGSKQTPEPVADASLYPPIAPAMQERPKSIAALVLGIIGLIAWLFPLAGLPVTIVGLVLSVNGMKAQKAYAKAGLVLNIIGLVLTIINSAIGAFMGANGMLF